MQSKGLAILRDLALQHSRWKHPTMKEEWRCTHNYTDRTSNGLTKCVIDFLRFNGYQAERINCTGRAIDNSKIITDILGDMRHIGSMKWLPTSGQKGTADISCIVRGRSIKIEVKMKDKQSPAQIEYQKQVERAGGLYEICHSFDEFLTFYNSMK